MKGGNKFLMWAKAYSLKRQQEIMYCWLAGTSILLIIIGITFAKMFAFNMAHVPLPGFIIAFCVIFFFRNYFFNAKTNVKLGLKYLLKQKEERRLDNYKYFVDEKWRKADDYKEITVAIEEMQQLQKSL
jgi:hypothetical protein